MNRKIQKRIIILSFLFTFISIYTLKAQVTPLQYIETYKDLAIYNRIKFGIPASITLAQALTESGGGQSDLSKRSNAQFGIKAWHDWQHLVVMQSDDRPDDYFRVYPTVEDSFLDHAKFLQKSNYKNLYEIPVTDYKGWAEGLLKAKYATNPKYSTKLIEIIERYQLDQYDAPLSEKEEKALIAKVENRLPTSVLIADSIKGIRENPRNKMNHYKEWEIMVSDGKQTKIAFKEDVSDGIRKAYVLKSESATKTPPKQNLPQDRELNRHEKNESDEPQPIQTSGIREIPKHTFRIKAEAGDTFRSLAKASGIEEQVLREYTEVPEKYILQVGDYVYLQKKRARADKPNFEHLVKEGETLRNISDQYLIKIASLFDLNNLPAGFELNKGMILKIR